MDICCICLNNQDNNFKPYQCDHYIHFNCFKSWSKECPLCKSKSKKNNYNITYTIHKNKRKSYLRRPLTNKKKSKFGDNYEQVQFPNGNWYDVEKNNYFEILFGNKWMIVSHDLLETLNRTTY